jgi:hypothetical protein
MLETWVPRSSESRLKDKSGVVEPHALLGTSPVASVLGSSADSSWSNTPKAASFLLGTSPPVGSAEGSGSGFSGKEGKRCPAKLFWSRLLYDDSLDANEFQVNHLVQ